MTFWKRKPKPETVYLDGLVTPSGAIIPLVQTPRGEAFYHYCEEDGIYRMIDGKIMAYGGLTYSIIFDGWRPIKPDEPHYGEAVALLQKEAIDRSAK